MAKKKITKQISEKNIEQSLKESEVFYQHLAELTPEAVVVHSKGIIVYANQAALKFVKAKKLEEVIGKPVMQFIHKDSVSLIQKRIQTMLGKGKAAPFAEEKFITLKGEIVIAEVKAIPFDFKGQPAILAVLHDITEQKKNKQTLQASEERFRTLIQNSADGIELFDEHANILYASNSVEKVLGYDPKEILNHTPEAFVHPDDQQYFFSKFSSLLTKPNKQVTAEYRVKHKNGQWVWIEATGVNYLHKPHVNAIVGNFHNITERKVAEEKLSHANQTLQAIISASPLAVYVLDKKGRVIMWNRVAEKMFGWKEKEVIGKPLPIVQTSKKRDFQEFMKLLLSGKSFSTETVRRRKNGSLFDISISAAPIFDENGNVINIVAIASDISERKQNEEKLRYSASIVNSISDAVIVTDIKYRIQSWNKSAEELYGWKEKEVIGKNSRKVFSVKYVNSIDNPETTTNTLYKKGYWEGETMQKRKDGSILFANSSVSLVKNEKGKNIGVVAITRDITRRRQTEERLMESEERLRLAVEAGNIGVWDWDIINNKINWSDKVYEIHGLKKDEFKGNLNNYVVQVHPDDKERVEKAIDKAVKEHVPYDIEFRIVTPEGKTRWISTSAIVMYEAKKPTRMLGATIDITKRKELEQQKDDFMGIVSHELKTPVTSLKAYEQVLQRRFKKKNDTDAVNMLQKMDGQINKLTSLIQDLLDVTKIEGGRLQFHEEKFYFDDLVDEIVEEIQRTTERHKIEIRGKTKKHILGDKDRIGQVLTNFLTNAIKYSPHTSEIIVETHSDTKSVTLRVKDFGVGIPKKDLPFVFQRFFRVNAPTHITVPGMGLGLYISSEIIKRQGGKIWLESTPTEGSTFSFSLPIKSSIKKQQTNTLVEEEVKHG